MGEGGCQDRKSFFFAKSDGFQADASSPPGSVRCTAAQSLPLDELFPSRRVRRFIAKAPASLSERRVLCTAARAPCRMLSSDDRARVQSLCHAVRVFGTFVLAPTDKTHDGPKEITKSAATPTAVLKRRTSGSLIANCILLRWSINKGGSK